MDRRRAAGALLALAACIACSAAGESLLLTPTPRVHVSVGLLSLCYPECDTTKRLLTPEREIHSLHKDKL